MMSVSPAKEREPFLMMREKASRLCIRVLRIVSGSSDGTSSAAKRFPVSDVAFSCSCRMILSYSKMDNAFLFLNSFPFLSIFNIA